MRSECHKYQKNISASLLGDLTEEEQRALEDHLAACSDCRLERENYIRTLDLMRSVNDETVPHHFLVHPQEEISNPRQLFGQMKPIWKTAIAAAAALFLLIGVAAASRLQIRSDPSGWVLSFSRSDIDVAALKKDILETAEERNRQATTAWIQQVKDEIERSTADLTDRQKADLTAAMARLDSRFSQRLDTAEVRMKDDSQRLTDEIYQRIAGQRERDLEAINLRFDGLETSSALKDWQTNAVLDTLVQVAELSLRETGGQK